MWRIMILYFVRKHYYCQGPPYCHVLSVSTVMRLRSSLTSQHCLPVRMLINYHYFANVGSSDIKSLNFFSHSCSPRISDSHCESVIQLQYQKNRLQITNYSSYGWENGEGRNFKKNHMARSGTLLCTLM